MAQPPLPQSSSSSSAAVTFANPLPQSPRSDILEWRFPAPHHNLTLIGRSRAAWHTSFIIPQLSLLLDAGLCVNAQRPKHIFLTHGHNDHCLLTPAFVNKNREKGGEDIYCPVEMAEPLGKFITGSRECNWSGDEEAKKKSDGKAGGYKILGVRSGDLVQLGDGQGQGQGQGATKGGWSAEVVKCDHTIPCVGYVFGVTTRRLKDEFKGLKGDQIKKLREEEGVEVTAQVRTDVFGFMGDTTTKVFEEEENGGGGGPMEAALERGIKVVITECSFLWEEHRAQAEKTKHTIWGDLEKVVRRWPGTVFVLMHFSMRYTNEDVARFFKEMEDPPGNIVVWADGEI
ncbi:beta-lactamase-like protein [Cladorrhinum samala]|uniref:Beta-lactamase-like protein n=1 Tax=Cladorrhinum samala TaxID=585594 RepID=A0AAV9HID1_9PEZI|nr:beta-lactamase-like protein [Cladorrhinum samala]